MLKLFEKADCMNKNMNKNVVQNTISNSGLSDLSQGCFCVDCLREHHGNNRVGAAIPSGPDSGVSGKTTSFLWEGKVCGATFLNERYLQGAHLQDEDEIALTTAILQANDVKKKCFQIGSSVFYCASSSTLLSLDIPATIIQLIPQHDGSCNYIIEFNEGGTLITCTTDITTLRVRSDIQKPKRKAQLECIDCNNQKFSSTRSFKIHRKSKHFDESSPKKASQTSQHKKLKLSPGESVTLNDEFARSASQTDNFDSRPEHGNVKTVSKNHKCDFCDLSFREELPSMLCPCTVFGKPEGVISGSNAIKISLRYVSVT